MRPGDRVTIRVPNWHKRAGKWRSEPTGHEVTVTAVFPEYIEFEGEPWSTDMMISRRQIVSAR